MADRASLVFRAQLAQEAERHMDAFNFMAQLSAHLQDADTDAEYLVYYYNRLTWEEAVLFASVTNAVLAHEVMPMVRVASDALFEEQMTAQRRMRPMVGEGDEAEVGWTRAQATLRAKVARALLERAQARLESLSAQCLAALAPMPNGFHQQSSEHIVTYNTVKGDLLSFLASSHSGAARAALVSEAHAAYQLALDQEELFSCHPARLRLARSVSLFYHDHLQRCDEAVRIADKAFDAALEDIDCIDEDSYKIICVILQDLRDNARQWEAEGGTDEADLFGWVTETQ